MRRTAAARHTPRPSLAPFAALPRLPRLARLAALGAGLAAPSLLASPAAAQPPEGQEPAGRVHLAASAEREVPNDRAVVTLELTAEGEEPGELARRVSRELAAALEIARRAPGVELRTGAVRTRPVYHEGRLRRWRATQQVVLETGELEDLPELLGALQERVPVRQVAFTLSEKARRKAEDALLDQALDRFQARAGRVAEGLGAPGFRFHELFVETDGAGPPRPLYQDRAVAMESARAEPVPLEPGTARVTVTVRGSVQLDLP